MGQVMNPSYNGVVGTDAGISGQQAVAIHTDGTLIAVAKQDATVIKVNASTNGGDTWVEVANITAPVALDAIAIGQYADGSLAIVGRAANRLSYRFVKVTFSNWAVSQWETVISFAAPNSAEKFDVDVSDSGTVGVAFQRWSGSNALFAQFHARTPGGTWSGTALIPLYSAGVRRMSGEAISVIALNAASGVRDWLIATACTTSQGDRGIDIYSVRRNESSGALVGDVESRATAFQTATVSTSVTVGNNRHIRLFRIGATSEFALMTYAQMAGTTQPKFSVYRGSLNGNTYTVGHASYFNAPVASELAGSFGFAMDGNKNMTFRYSRRVGSTAQRVQGTIAAIEGNTTFSQSELNFTEPVRTVTLSDGPRRNLDKSKLEVLYQEWDQVNSMGPVSLYRASVPNPNGASAVVSVSPNAGSGDSTSNPALKAFVDTDLSYSPSAFRVEWQFATDAGFVNNLITYRQPVQYSRKVEGTDSAGVTVLFEDSLHAFYTLTRGAWFIRARVVDFFGNAGLWSTPQTFMVGHPPRLIPLSPSGSGYYTWSGGSRTFTWDFTDPSLTDYQTAFQLIFRTQAGATIFDTGKVVGNAHSYTRTFDASVKDQFISWSGRAWDSFDTPGPYSEQEWFNLSEPASATIQYPAQNQAIGTAVPTFQFTPITGVGRTIKEYTILVTQGANTIWSKRVASPTPGNTVINVKMDQGVLQNNSNYSVQVLVRDSMDIQGTSPIVPFSTAWSPASTPTGLQTFDFNYNVEGHGYVELTWTDAARDPGFTSWDIYRRDDLIDIHTGIVIKEGKWNLIHQDYEIGNAYSFRDYFAPSNYKVNYRIVQAVNFNGSDIVSAPSDSVAAYPSSDGYWLIEPSVGNNFAEVFKLANVTADSFTDEQEEEEIIIIGRGRVFNKGQRLGEKGSLEAQIRDTGGTSARQKRQRLVEMQQETRQLWMRNPFGDIFKVNVSAMSISRIAGAGRSEYCDVSIPYARVS